MNIGDLVQIQHDRPNWFQVGEESRRYTGMRGVVIEDHVIRVMALEEFRHQINEFEMALGADEAPEVFRIEVRAATGFLVAAMQHRDHPPGNQLEGG
jgi:hypothetical protein